MSADYSVRDRVALITGAGNGIGAACARMFYEAGARLVLVDIAMEDLKSVAASMDPERVLVAPSSVTDRRRLDEVVAEARAKFGRIDVVLANAGIACEPPRTLRTIDEDHFERIVEVDLLGVWRTVRACLPSIIESGGYVLATSSIYAFVNGVANIPYAASKAGVEMMMRGLRVELAGTGATAGVLIPGWIETHIAESALGKHPIAGAMVRLAYPPFLRRPLQPEAVATAVLRGIRFRARSVVVPSRWTPLSLLRGLLSFASDRLLESNPRFHQLIGELEAEAASSSKRKNP